MNSPKRTRPADAATSGRPRGIDQISNDRPLNTASATETQAPSLADTAGEDDETFFRRRPRVNTRTRLPFESEFPPGVLERGAFVHVLIIRNSDGSPGTRAHAIFYSNIDGGRA
jgi:hypothetical protein